MASRKDDVMRFLGFLGSLEYSFTKTVTAVDNSFETKTVFKDVARIVVGFS